MTAAELSTCRTYRYALWRDLGSLLSTQTVLFVMLNPSTADATQDDPTIARCRGFAESLNCGRLAVANLYAYRATAPSALHDAEDPVGPQNDEWIQRLAADADRIIAAWGSDAGPIADRAERVLGMLGDEVDALGLCANGQPRHPLYLRSDVEPQPFSLDMSEAA